MAQSNKICQHCGLLGHSKFYCPTRPKKAIKQISTLKKTNPKIATKKQGSVKNKIKSQSRPKLVKELDSIFSWYIRLRHAVRHNDELMAICVTCKSMKRWQDQQNGHFYTRGRQATRWDEMNCNVQCMRCNVFLKGNYINYTIFMIDTYGRDAVDELERKSLSSDKIATVKLGEMIAYYRGQVDILLKHG